MYNVRKVAMKETLSSHVEKALIFGSGFRMELFVVYKQRYILEDES